MTDTPAKPTTTGTDPEFPLLRQLSNDRTEAELMAAFDAHLAAELDEAIAAEIAAEDAWNAAWQDARRRGTEPPALPPAM